MASPGIGRMPRDLAIVSRARHPDCGSRQERAWQAYRPQSAALVVRMRLDPRSLLCDPILITRAMRPRAEFGHCAQVSVSSMGESEAASQVCLQLSVDLLDSHVYLT